MAPANFCATCPVRGRFNAEDQTCSVVDPDDGLPLACIGQWAEEKHTRVKKYVDISRATRRKYTGGMGGSSFIDLYCGPGRGRIRETDRIVDGSAIAAAKAAIDGNVPYSEIIIADANEAFVSASRARLERIGCKVTSLVGSADTTVTAVIDSLSVHGLHFAFLDPYDLKSLPFAIIQKLATLKRMDMLIHVSVQDLQRNLDSYLKSDSSPLDGFAPGWKKRFKELHTKSDGRRKVFEHWLSLVREQDMKPSQGVEEVTGSKNQHLYWLVFAARHELAIRFWDQIRTVTDQKSLGL